MNPGYQVITVAGTNGKGSIAAILESVYHQAGYRVACYTSPHLLHYNERIRIGKENVRIPCYAKPSILSTRHVVKPA